MKFFNAFIGSVIVTTALFSSSTQCQGIYYGNEAPDILNAKLQTKTKELCYTSFALMHSGVSRTALWSAEHLTREGLQSKSKRSNDFHTEDQLPSSERSELSDYARSGYDRGHLSPSADMSTKAAQHECFTLANMVPQNGDNNRGIWADIEGATRELAKSKNELYVITGPLFIGSNVQRLKGRVFIPTKMYKAIYDPSSGQGAAYLVNNSAGRDYTVISISELEKTAGIRFFPKMSASSKKTAMDLPVPQERGNHSNHSNSSNNNDDDLLRTIEKLLKWMIH
ncbi:MAG: DNA/RNA non-specific endonuclease [Sulfurimonas sp.]|jgi:endonuclease G